MLSAPRARPVIEPLHGGRSPVYPMAADGAWVVMQSGVDAARLPFDAARLSYATGVRLGLIRRSMLASSEFARALRSAERLALGPLARSV